MVAFDTNVVVRLLVGDEPVQTRKADAALRAHAPSEGVFISLLVLVETAWVLGQVYGLDRDEVGRRLSSLVRTQGIMVEEPSLVLDALDEVEKGGHDLADVLIAHVARREGAVPILTFDRKLARMPDVRLL